MWPEMKRESPMEELARLEQHLARQRDKLTMFRHDRFSEWMIHEQERYVQAVERRITALKWNKAA